MFISSFGGRDIFQEQPWIIEKRSVRWRLASDVQNVVVIPLPIRARIEVRRGNALITKKGDRVTPDVAGDLRDKEAPVIRRVLGADGDVQVDNCAVSRGTDKIVRGGVCGGAYEMRAAPTKAAAA